jgi:hypothetical protein
MSRLSKLALAPARAHRVRGAQTLRDSLPEKETFDREIVAHGRPKNGKSLEKPGIRNTRVRKNPAFERLFNRERFIEGAAGNH